MPKKRNSFSVHFSDAAGEAISLGQLGPHVTAVDLGTELFEPVATEELKHRTNTVILWIADDSANTVMKAIRAWTKDGNRQFTLTVNLFEQGPFSPRKTDIFVFKHAQLSAMQHSIFTFASEPDDDSVKLLQLAFGELEHHIVDSLQ